ncbi:hypothetical protein AgCh_025521 [Apium graveolens]
MLNDGKSRFSINGKPILHFVRTTTFSEYTAIHVDCVSKINSPAHLDKVYGLSFRISIGLGSTLNIVKSKKGSTVAVFGMGALGLAVVEGARIAGASRIIGVDLNPNRFESAKKFGVTEFVNPKDHNKPVQEVIFEMTNGGVDRSIECMGHVAFEIVSCIDGSLRCDSGGKWLARIGGVVQSINGELLLQFVGPSTATKVLEVEYLALDTLLEILKGSC